MLGLHCGLYCRAVCITKNFSEAQNPQFIIKSSFKSRVGYNRKQFFFYKKRAVFLQKMKFELANIMCFSTKSVPDWCDSPDSAKPH